MKIIILIFTTIFVLNSYANENLQWVDQQIEAIQPQREGLLKKDISSVKNPFTLAMPSKKKVLKDGKIVMVKPPSKPKPLIVKSIINNRAMIDGKWYELSDKIRDYTILEIDEKSVLLKNKKHELKLFIIQDNTNSKIKITKE